MRPRRYGARFKALPPRRLFLDRQSTLCAPMCRIHFLAGSLLSAQQQTSAEDLRHANGKGDQAVRLAFSQGCILSKLYLDYRAPALLRIWITCGSSLVCDGARLASGLCA